MSLSDTYYDNDNLQGQDTGAYYGLRDLVWNLYHIDGLTIDEVAEQAHTSVEYVQEILSIDY